METVLLQINDSKAYKLLEHLNIVKVLERNVQPAQKLSEKYAGKLPTSIADELQNYITESRNEWKSKGI